VSRALRRDVARVVVALVVGGLAIGAFATYRIWEQAGRDERRPAGAIVVLGAAQYNGRPSAIFRSRLEHAIQLWRDGFAPVIVVTGGKRERDVTTEAAAGRAFAIEAGVPDDRILSEDRGRNTAESILAVAKLLDDNEIDDAIFVSSPSHMLRVLRMARDQGVTAYGSPTRTGPSEQDVGRRIEATSHELAALALYFVAGSGAAQD
jgi:uncharacterized SAM-binding protein YcdF (DUF218 family)